MNGAVPINYLAVLVCSVLYMVVGSLWYGPLFGKTWAGLMGITMDPAKMQGMWKNYLLMFVGALLMNFVLAHAMVFAIAYLKFGGVPGGLMGGFWNWLGFVAPVMLGSVLWEGKPWKLWMINAGYYLVVLLMSGVIFAVWQ